jgi:hypothetical protein
MFAVGLVGAFSLASLMLAPYAADAAATASGTINQCNGDNGTAKGATTGMTCTVTVVNTISGTKRSSTTTVFRHCTLGPCTGPTATGTTSSTSLVTHVTQCNSSANDSAISAPPITCDVTITNNISASTPGAKPVTAATVNQCVGSAAGGGGSVICHPFPATTTSATVTECNGSANGGGGTVNCTVTSDSTISPAIPITVNQCNGTGNKGGTVVKCETAITTHITPAVVATPTPTPTPTQVAVVPPGGIATGGGSTAGLRDGGLLTVGLALLMAAGTCGLLRWRIGSRG